MKSARRALIARGVVSVCSPGSQSCRVNRAKIPSRRDRLSRDYGGYVCDKNTWRRPKALPLSVARAGPSFRGHPQKEIELGRSHRGAFTGCPSSSVWRSCRESPVRPTILRQLPEARRCLLRPHPARERSSARDRLELPLARRLAVDVFNRYRRPVRWLS